MAAYDYVALTAEGNKRRGVVQADSAYQARQLVRDQALLPVEVSLGAAKEEKVFGIPLNFYRLNSLELSEFTRQFAVLLQAGIPIDEALAALANQSGKSRVKRCALKLRSLLMEGYSLSDAMAQQPQVFSRLYRAMVRAGEESGALEHVLERLADHLENNRTLSNNIRMALAYPSILTVVAIGVIMVLMSYVVPKIVEQFNQADQSLPVITNLLINTSHFLSQYWYLLVLGFCILIVAVIFVKANPVLSKKFDRFALAVPILRKFAVMIAFARLSRTLHILLVSGINFLDSLKVATDVVGNAVLREQLGTVYLSVKEGGALVNSIQPMGPPSMFSCLVENGERSGDLSAAFGRAADMLENSMQERIKLTLTLFEPLLILVMGGCVLGIVLAILLPILELNNMTLM